MSARTRWATIAALALLAAACNKESKPAGEEGSKSAAAGVSDKGEAAKAKPAAAPPAPPLPPPELYSASHILIGYKGAMRANPKVTRSKEEAQKLAEKLAKQAQAKPETFAELAKANSDGPTGPRGGNLGAWPKGRMVPAFDAAVSKLEVGKVSDPVETPFGFHVIKREALPEQYAAAHILVAYKGATRANPTVTRSKEEAQKLAEKLAKQAKENPETFAAMAEKSSDGPSAGRGGKLGTWHKGRMVPPFEAALDKLEVGGISDPVETPFGFHVIKREKP